MTDKGSYVSGEIKLHSFTLVLVHISYFIKTVKLFFINNQYIHKIINILVNVFQNFTFLTCGCLLILLIS
jgi:hypothetical protein